MLSMPHKRLLDIRQFSNINANGRSLVEHLLPMAPSLKELQPPWFHRLIGPLQRSLRTILLNLEGFGLNGVKIATAPCIGWPCVN
jgi:hypothetical protein